MIDNLIYKVFSTPPKTDFNPLIFALKDSAEAFAG
jgi:hypothetical protein